MATPSMADFTESFAHLTLDNTDKLSTTDEISIHSLPDLQAFLELARHHDDEARKNDDKHEFQTSAISSHLTPLIRNDGKLQHRRNVVSENPIETSDYTNNHQHLDKRKSASQPDAAALFKALKPFIDEYLARHGGGPINSAAHYSHHEQDLDMDLKVEDTFDKIRRRSIDSNRSASPLTSPPQSSESHLTDSRGTFVDEDLCRPMTNRDEHKIDKIENNIHGKNGIPKTVIQTVVDSGHFSDKRFADSDPEFDDAVADSDAEPPQIHLAELTTHEIDLGSKDLHAMEKNIAELRVELEQYKQENTEMINELNFLRRQVKDKSPQNHQASTLKDKALPSGPTNPSNLTGPTNPTRPTDPTNSSAGAKQLQTPTEISETEKPMDESSIPKEFRPYYHRLQLEKVETLTSAEKSNLIKHIMLSLLVSDYDHLPSVMPQVGCYLRLTSKFLDNLHRKLYDNNEVGPLRYLRDYNLHTDDGLEECLNGMFTMLM